MPSIDGLGHVGIFVDDMQRQRDFYTRVLGLAIADEDLDMAVGDDGKGICFLSASPDNEHHELVLMGGRQSDSTTRVVQQISFKVPSVDDLRDYYHRLQSEHVTFESIISHGNALGVYFADPEGNTVELYYKTGFNVPQPHGKPINLDDSTEDLLAFAKSFETN